MGAFCDVALASWARASSGGSVPGARAETGGGLPAPGGVAVWPSATPGSPTAISVERTIRGKRADRPRARRRFSILSTFSQSAEPGFDAGGFVRSTPAGRPSQTPPCASRAGGRSRGARRQDAPVLRRQARPDPGVGRRERTQHSALGDAPVVKRVHHVERRDDASAAEAGRWRGGSSWESAV